MLRNFLCWLGLHIYDQNPISKEFLKSEGRDFLFFTSAIQKGVSKCTNTSCLVESKVYRTGMCGSGGNAGRWRKLDAKVEKYIDSLPVL